MATFSSSSLANLQAELVRLHDEKATGTLCFERQGAAVCELFLLSGRLLYIVDNLHRVRRWQQAIAEHCPQWTAPGQPQYQQPWEYDLLYQGISSGQLAVEKGKAVIQAIAKGCWLELALMKQFNLRWQGYERIRATFSFFLSLSVEDDNQGLEQAEHFYQEWQKAGLGSYRTSLSPILTEKGDQINNPKLQAYLKGQYTLWEIAYRIKQPLVTVTRSLAVWNNKGLLSFEAIADLPSPVIAMPANLPAPSEAVSSPTTPPVPKATATLPTTKPLASAPPASVPPANPNRGSYLIACIDDSAIVVHNLKTILIPAGFQVLPIHEPMAGFAQLIEYKPDLILLDLNMPNADGYSVCKFLRDTPVFGKTPIIILTGQDSVIDRTRAKLVGANDFITKPPDGPALIALIHTYLPAQGASQGHSMGAVPKLA
jgi:chemotaxis family two-component system response regulator PixG